MASDQRARQRIAAARQLSERLRRAGKLDEVGVSPWRLPNPTQQTPQETCMRGLFRFRVFSESLDRETDYPPSLLQTQ